MILFSFLRHYNKCIWKAALLYFYNSLLLFLFIQIFIPLIILNIFIVSFKLSYYLMFSGLFIHLTLLFGFASCPVWFASFLCWHNTFRTSLSEILLHPMFMEVVLGSEEHCSQVFWGFTFSVRQVNE